MRDYSVVQIVLDSLKRHHPEIRYDTSPQGFTLVRVYHALIISMWCRDLFSCDREGLRRLLYQLAKLSDINYLTLFDELSSRMLEFVKISANMEDFVNSLKGGQSIPGLLVHTCRLAVSLYDDRESFRIFRNIFEFPLRFDNGLWAQDDYGKFVETNESLIRDDRVKPFICVARSISAKIYSRDFVNDVLRRFRPHHGPGSVVYSESLSSGRLSLKQKDSILLGSLRRTSYFCENILNARYWPQPPLTEIPAKVISVPKSWKTRRLIAIEPSNSMWWREGIREGLYYAISRNPILRDSIDFRNVDRNKELCKQGSVDGSYATIDLSHASDSVSFWLVKALFEHTPLWKYIENCRQTTFSIPEQSGRSVVTSNMFATMGNAICFPIETMVFDLLVRTVKHLLKDRKQHFVFGDDIIVSQRSFNSTIHLLQLCGFTVNLKKTFSGMSKFRESCGAEWFDGLDVAPLRIPRGFVGLPTTRCDSLAILQSVALANKAYTICRPLYKYIVEHLCVSLGLQLPFSRDGSIGLINQDPLLAMSSYPRSLNATTSQHGKEVDWVLPCSSRTENRTTIALLEWFALADWRGNAPIEDAIVTSRDSSREQLSVCRCNYYYNDILYIEKCR